MKNKIDLLIIGAGFSGMGASVTATRNKINNRIIELNPEPGGLCRSTVLNKCTFDLGPRILLFKNEIIKRELLSYIEENYVEKELSETTYLKDYGQIGFPLQKKLYTLPTHIRHKILNEIKQAHNDIIKPVSYKDWLISNYGETLSKLVLIPYEEKKWQINIDEMTYEWALKRPVNVDYSEIVKGANSNLKTNNYYCYPKNGSIASLSTALANKCDDILYNFKVTEININEKYVTDGKDRIYFNKLISTAPIDSTVKLLRGNRINKDLLIESEKLRWLNIKVINLVYEGRLMPPGSAIYFPEKSFIFRRLSILPNLCPALARTGLIPISAEISLNEELKYSDAKIIEKTIFDIRNVKGFEKLYSPLDYQVINIAKAYPIQNSTSTTIVNNIKNNLAKYDIYTCGRGGNFTYCNCDEAYQQGQELVNNL